MLIDKTGSIKEFNPTAELLFGWGESEVIGQNVRMLMPEPYRSEHDQYLQHYLKTGEQKVIGKYRELTGLRRDGTTFPLELTVNKVTIDNKPCFIGSIRDISTRKRLEKLLISRQRELQRSNEELTKFAYVASHDLQEPLRKVQAFGDRLMARYAEHLDETGQDYLQRMLHAATRMRRLIDDLLAFSRINTRGDAFIRVDLNQILADVLGDLEVHIKETGASIVTQGLPVIEADALQMRQLFQNLISNALKFGRADLPPVINIDYSSARGNDIDGTETDMCTLRFSDNGIGFEQKYATQIFDVFQRLHSRSDYEGTGVGLAICKRIAERHRGFIRAEGRPGNGAVFYVTLRRQQAQPHDEYSST